MDTNELNQNLLAAVKALTAAQTALERAVREAAEADHFFNLRYSQALLKVKAADDKMTVAEVEARTMLSEVVEGGTVEDLRHRKVLTAGLEKSAGLRVKGALQNLSAVQSVGGLYRSELEALRYGPGAA